MKYFNLCVGIVAFFLFSTTPSEAGRLTHMGQKASNHVTLSSFRGSPDGCRNLRGFSRILPDGSAEKIFRIPKNKTLIVTDVDWQYVHPDGGNATGTKQTLRLFIENRADPYTSRRAFESTIILSDTGAGGISESMTSGFAVSSEARICPDVTPGPSGPPFGIQHIIIRGYLSPNL